MKIALPEHQGRIAPVFDCCRTLWVCGLARDDFTIEGREDWSSLSLQRRPVRLREMGIELLLCGGISCRLEEQIRNQGIPVLPWLAGDVREILAAFKDGRIGDPAFEMPGRSRCRRRAGFGTVNCRRTRNTARGPQREEKSNAKT
ncbi:MAG: hypothetical protein AB1646_19295 [Thermodesulfobacteriota bacterium]